MTQSGRTLARSEIENQIYWNLLSRSQSRLEGDPRMNIGLGTLDRKPGGERRYVKAHAIGVERNLTRDEYL